MAKGVIAVALSGGMDSLRAAVLLQEQGYDVVGLFMMLIPSGNSRRDSSLDRLRIITEKFSIPLLKVNVEEIFEQNVISPFIKAYLGGLTPNPCVVCNSSVKFGFLLDFWKLHRNEICASFGISSKPLPFLATGHYVATVHPEDNPYGFRWGIMRHFDTAKDQSYFLYRLSQEQLRHAIFPLVSEKKRDVANWVTSTGVGDFIGVESQEICFIPSGNYVRFIEERIPDVTLSFGPIKDTSGRVLGYHRGLHRYTIGQRRGIGIPSSAPYYVLKISPEENTLYVGRRDELVSGVCYVHDVRWVSITCPAGRFRAQVKIRNQHEPTPATVEPLGEDRAMVRFDVPQQAVTPGQSAVFYEGMWLLGGGIIAGGDVPVK